VLHVYTHCGWVDSAAVAILVGLLNFETHVLDRFEERSEGKQTTRSFLILFLTLDKHLSVLPAAPKVAAAGRKRAHSKATQPRHEGWHLTVDRSGKLK